MAKKGKYVYEWPRPMVTVDAVVFRLSDKRAEVLLIQRKSEPYKGCWALPGGFVGIDEELEDAAARELFEETALKDIKLEQMHTFGGVGRDPRGRDISVVYTGIVVDIQKKVKGGDDAEKAKWFAVDRLPENLAFDHREIVELAISKIRKQTLD